MRKKRRSIVLRATLAVFTVALFVTSTWAATHWSEQVRHNLGSGTDGVYSFAGLVLDADGNLYGATETGGTYGRGTVFQLTPKAGDGRTETVLYSFQPNGTDGNYPLASLIFDAAGNLYGTTQRGGAYGFGTVFELTPTAGGGWTEKVLHHFGYSTDGSAPFSGLIFDGVGNLYGTTFYGGTYGSGTAFELTPTAGGDWTEQVLHSFGNSADGSKPNAGLIIDAASSLYGTTVFGGTYSAGTVFELTPVYPCARCGPR